MPIVEPALDEALVTRELSTFISVANVVWNIRAWCDREYGSQVDSTLVSRMRDSMPDRATRLLTRDAEQLLRIAWQTELAAFPTHLMSRSFGGWPPRRERHGECGGLGTPPHRGTHQGCPSGSKGPWRPSGRP